MLRTTEQKITVARNESNAPTLLNLLPETTFQPLNFIHLRFHFRAATPIQLPTYSGSAWRGLFGKTLKKAVCVTKEPHCKECTLYHSCLHSEVFEAPVPPRAQKMRLYPSAPHPYVIRPASNQVRKMQPGAASWFDLLVYGHSIRHLTTISNAIISSGTIGIGSSRGQFTIEKVEQIIESNEEPHLLFNPADGYCGANLTSPLKPVPAVPKAVTIELLTPLRIRIDQKNMNAKTFNSRAFFSTLIRRYSMMCYFHGGFEVNANFKQLITASNELDISNAALRWTDLKRYSSRQQNEIPIGGLVGTFDLSGTALSMLWPLLWLGQSLHLGKGAVLGLGQYQLHTTSLPPRKL